jgi:dolichyl-phosphate beta-glucosyltransferase
MIKSISIVFPFYNEKKRILSCLNQIKKFKPIKIITEFIFVDDGSNDGTDLIIKNFLKKEKRQWKLIKIKKNMGKGYALKMGVLNAKNQWILTSDTDMSVPLEQILKWNKNKYFKKNCSIYFGSREHNNSIVETKIYRKVLGKIFRTIIKILLKITVNDTQCGYKLYKRAIGKKIFKDLTLNKFEHDLEIILNAQKINQSIIELPVEWTHKKNSKLNILIDPIKMLYGIILLSFKLKNF